jgi:hypothetical protein
MNCTTIKLVPFKDQLKIVLGLELRALHLPVRCSTQGFLFLLIWREGLTFAQDLDHYPPILASPKLGG